MEVEMAEEEILLEHQTEDGLDLVRFVNPVVKEGMGVLLLEDELRQILSGDRDGPPAVAIDFTSVRFISTTALAKLISFYKNILAQKGRLILCGLQPPVADVFQVTGFDKFFRIVGDMETARRELAR
jgi:anti-anti-sigma factor